MKIASVVTTYNRPDALAAVLEGWLAQEDRDFELIVADDGSTDETRRVVDGYRARTPFPLSHVWQEDAGFRAAAIRNRATAATAADYIVFTDGDCVPSPGFVAAHRALAEPGWFVAGNRVLLSPEFTRAVLAERMPIHAWGRVDWIARWLHRDLNRLLPLLALSAEATWRKRKPLQWEGVKTCNLAVWRDDLIRVNGLDESYSGWGLEDSDLVIRLLHAGIGHKSGRFGTPLFHLWHRENDRSKLQENRRRLDEILASDKVRAERGLDQYL